MSSQPGSSSRPIAQIWEEIKKARDRGDYDRAAELTAQAINAREGSQGGSSESDPGQSQTGSAAKGKER